MLVRLVGFLILFLFVSKVFSQHIIQGRLLKKSDNTPIAYANIGIPNSPIGTISNVDGSFEIKVPEKYVNESILFSALGFQRKSYKIKYLVRDANAVIFLSEQPTLLDDVVISSKKVSRKSAEFGNRYWTGGSIYADSTAAGSALALLIENKYPSYHPELSPPYYIGKARVRISKNTFDRFKLRVRILERDTITGLPGKDLLNESVIISSKMPKGWLEVDLSPYNVSVKARSFFIAYEWIMDDDDRLTLLEQYQAFKKLFPEKFSVDTVFTDGEKVVFHSWHGFAPGTSLGTSMHRFSIENYKSYYRTNSHGVWKRAHAPLAARVTVSNWPPATRKNFTHRQAQPCAASDVSCKASTLVKSFQEEHEVPGIQVAVSLKGSVVYAENFGFSNVDKNLPVLPSTQFRMGSVSKALTSAALIKLVSENKLDLDKPIQYYLPFFPNKKYPITTRQLAGHLAGIRHYTEGDRADLVRTKHFSTLKDGLIVFQNDSLLFEPGTRYHYSSFGWNLIGAIIEEISGLPFLQYMNTHVWKPLNLLHTYGDVADSVMPNRSEFYYASGEKAAYENFSYKYSSGGLLSTASDLVQYGHAMLTGKFADTSLSAILFKSQTTQNGQRTGYGLGWNNVMDKNNHRVYFHAGALLNSSAYLLLYPDDDLVISFLANSSEGIHFDIENFASIFFPDNK